MVADGSTTVNLTGDDVFTYTSGGSSANVLQTIWGLGQAIQNGDYDIRLAAILPH